jgi:CheY-like chemotaxis protein
MLVDYVRANAAANKQIKELFTRIQATVSLMMTNMNADHPHRTHLHRIEEMSKRGLGVAKSVPPPVVVKRKGTQRETKTAPTAGRPPASEVMRGTECVLLADGNDMFLNIGKEMLEAMGYRVLTAKTGQEALAMYRDQREPIALVVLGLVTPETTGTVTVYKDLRNLDPDVAVLISNGYGMDGDLRQIVDNKKTAFIERPFSMKALSQEMRNLLDNHGPRH